MPVSPVSSIIVRGALQDVSIAYRNSSYVADQVFPLIDKIGRKVKVAKYQKGAWFRDEAEPRAPGTAARVGDMKVTSVNLDPVNYAFATQVTDEEVQEANKPGNLPIQPDIDAQEYLAEKLDLNREVRASALLHATDWNSVGAGGEDAEGHWGDGTAANDTFLADINKARDKILKSTGILPNKLLLSWPAWSKLQTAPALLALMNPTTLSRNALVTTEALQALIGMQLIIGAAVRTTHEENVNDDTFNPVWIWGTSGSEDKGIGFVYYAPDRPGLKTPSAGYQYRVMQESGSGRLITTWRDDSRHAQMYDCQEEVDIAAVGLDCGYLFKDTSTT